MKKHPVTFEVVKFDTKTKTITIKKVPYKKLKEKHEKASVRN
jgi:hypothetical protein